MPIALPPDNTPRAFITYQVNGRNHTMMVRLGDSISDGTISEDVSAFLTAMDPLLYATVFVKFERSAEGSNVRLPADWSGITEWGDGDAEQNAPTAWSFTGKDFEGHKFALQLFGRATEQSNNWRVFAADDSSVTAALAALETTDEVFLTINQAGPIYNQYANQSMNAYWQRQARK